MSDADTYSLDPVPLPPWKPDDAGGWVRVFKIRLAVPLDASQAASIEHELSEPEIVARVTLNTTRDGLTIVAMTGSDPYRSDDLFLISAFRLLRKVDGMSRIDSIEDVPRERWSMVGFDGG
jgi:hypothetical protein